MCRMTIGAGSKSRESGYIYYNALLDLVLLASLMPLIVLFYLHAANYMEDLDSGKIEWRLFAADLQTYLTAVDSIQTINGGTGFRVTQQSNEYDIELSGNVIRKQKFKEGHEIMLTDVVSCTFQIDGRVLRITALRSSGIEERSEYAITSP